tara:strand:+ start:1047 stop:1256 length:210 start_codon:yes stop_codon:yes gene_type:complete
MDEGMTPVEGHTSLKRDNYSSAIINTDADSYNSYMSQRDRKLKERQEIENLKKDVGEIKDMMKLILDKL